MVFSVMRLRTLLLEGTQASVSFLEKPVIEHVTLKCGFIYELL